MNQMEPEITGENRDESGKFAPGTSGNPSGRPIGSVSIRSSIRKRLKEVPEGEKESYLELIVSQIFARALKGDFQMLKLIWEQIDGRAKESLEIEETRRPTPLLGCAQCRESWMSPPVYGGLSQTNLNTGNTLQDL